MVFLGLAEAYQYLFAERIAAECVAPAAPARHSTIRFPEAKKQIEPHLQEWD